MRSRWGGEAGKDFPVIEISCFRAKGAVQLIEPCRLNSEEIKVGVIREIGRLAKLEQRARKQAVREGVSEEFPSFSGEYVFTLTYRGKPSDNYTHFRVRLDGDKKIIWQPGWMNEVSKAFLRLLRQRIKIAEE